MKRLLRRLIPPFLLQIYHWGLARCGTWWYRHPSRNIIVIGVTGTKGKSSTVSLITRVLEAAGHTVGAIATTHFKIGRREWVNETKQTMPGRFRLQRLLREMVRAGCTYVIVETSSEGIAQFRHVGVDYDIAVFTNLSPEHIESHGSYENYRDAKIELFRSLRHSYRKHLNGLTIKKVAVVNADDDEAGHFLESGADFRWTFSLEPERDDRGDPGHHVVAHNIVLNTDSIEFVIQHQLFRLWLLGKFNVYNVLAAVTVGLSQNIELSVMKEALQQTTQLPGRLEEIKNDRGVRIFVDYAHEPASLEAAYQAIHSLKPKRVISVLGSQGGGRDKAKRPVLGRLAAQYSDFVIVTNEDPYDEDPQIIINDVAAGALDAGKEHGVNCWTILERRQALQKALTIAEQGDIIIATGKGSETVMAVAGGKMIAWDDRKAFQELLTDTTHG